MDDISNTNSMLCTMDEERGREKLKRFHTMQENRPASKTIAASLSESAQAESKLARRR